MRWWSRTAVAAALALSVTVAMGAPGVLAAPKPLPQQWWFTAWDIENKVWPITRGNGVTVALLDSGVEASIPDLAGVVLPGTNISGPAGVADGRTDVDESLIPGHGTGLASIIASQGTRTGFLGVAPEVKILPVIVRGLVGAGPAIRYAVDQGAKVINVSQGGSGPCPTDMQQAVGYALSKDVVVIAAAGNQGDSTNFSANPANCIGVLAVGAVDSNAVPWTKTQRQPYVTVAAPGVDLVSIAKDGKIHRIPGGTSQATALTSAAAALVRSRFPQMSAREVVQRLIASTHDAGPKGRDDQTGYGVVRPIHALTDDVPPDAPNPVFDAYDKWAAENKAASTATARGNEDAGINWTLVATIAGLAIGAVLLLAVVLIMVLVNSRRRKRVRPPAGVPPYPPPGLPPMGAASHPWPGPPVAHPGRYPRQPGQPPAPGVPPQYQPPAGTAPYGPPPQPPPSQHAP